MLINYVTPYRYAKLSGLTRQAIYNRINKGTIKLVFVKSPTGTLDRYIDIDAYPPGRKEWSGGRPRKSNQEEMSK